MIDLNNSQNLAARPRADVLLACRGVASARSRILFLLAGRARHSVRAVVSGGARLLTSRLARTLAPPTPGRGLPALPVLPSLFVKGKIPLCGLAIAVALQLGVLAGSAQTNIYLFSGSETNITLPPGTYIITAYGAVGSGYYGGGYGGGGGGGAKMSAEFNFTTSTNLTLLVGGSGGDGGGYSGAGGGGGGGSFVVEGNTPLVIAGGGGGGSYYRSGGYGAVGPNGVAGGGGGDGGSALYYEYGSGGGGGGFLGDGTNGTGFVNHQGGGSGGGAGGGSFESGGGGAPFGYGGYFGGGGFGGGGGGGAGYYGGAGGGGGGGGGYSGGGGAGDENSDVGGGGGGGSIIDSSAITVLTEASGRRIVSPDDAYDGEIIITALPPPLTIIADGANVVLTWPAADTGFTTNGYKVESTTNLVPPVVWQTNSTAPIVIGGQNVIIIPITGSQQYFRLH